MTLAPMERARAAMLLGAKVWRSLRMRLTVVTLSILLLGIWGLVSYVSVTLRQNMVHALGEQQLATVSGIALALDRNMQDRVRALEALAQGRASVSRAGPQALQTEIHLLPAYQVLFNRGIFVLSADGAVLADEPPVPGRSGRNYMDDPDVARTLLQGKTTIGRPHLGVLLKTPVFSILVPILDERGVVLGAVGGITDLGLPNFLDQVSTTRAGKTGGYFLIEPRLRLFIIATDAKRNMTQLPPPGKIPRMEKLMQAREGTEVWVNPLGVEVLASGKPMATSGWVVAVALPTEEAFEPIRQVQQQLIAAAVAMSLLAALLVWLLLKKQLSPLVVAAADLRRRVRRNEPFQSLAVVRSDEIGDLIKGFNRLLAVLQQREYDLHETAHAREVAEAAMVAALAEKTGLLNEVHHRVKNNLQVITSLLRLEGGRSTQGDTRAVLLDMQGRIRSMALLHESLYRAGIFASVDLGTYLAQLTQQAFRTLVPQGGAVRLELDLASVRVNIDQATPCGLLVNELISNCFKHAFPDGRSGVVRVRLQPLPGSHQVQLQVADTGVGLAADFATKRSQSLGMQLVADLAKQLQGVLDMASTPEAGAVFTVTFSVPVDASSTTPEAP
ncbi:MAG: hypothetical protein RL302_943 [Pseudomonadota bacterium]|jgi:two-component sensor histidine kinase/HAMP domain-containing protein